MDDQSSGTRKAAMSVSRRDKIERLKNEIDKCMLEERHELPLLCGQMLSPVIITSCNGTGSWSFSKATIDYELAEGYQIWYWFNKTYMEILREIRYMHSMNAEQLKAFDCLLDFVYYDVHVNGLAKITGFTPRHESDTAMILAAHLLSKFAVEDSTSYIISNDSKFKSRYCPCGCKQELLYGNTYIGSEYLFHGKPDIVIFPKGAGSCGVLVPKAHGNELENWDEEDEVQMVEVKKTKKLLRNRHTENQVASLAITFSYFQRIRQHRKEIFLSDSEIVTVIPTISICGDCFDIYMYDTENDIFLRNYGDPIPLWQDSKTLNLSSILIIWMIINHMSFRPKIPDSMKIITGSCGLNQQLSDRRIEKIEETMRTQHSKFMPLQVQEDNIEGSVPIDFEAD